MADFNDKLNDLAKSYWQRPEEQAIINKIVKDKLNSVEDINNFIAQNKQVFELTSENFKKHLESLNESKMNNKRKILNINNGNEKWQVRIIDGNVKAKTQLREAENGVVKGGFIHWDNRFAIPYAVREKLDEMAIKGYFKEDISTADISIMDTPVLTEPLKKKHGKNIIDVHEGEDEETAKVTKRKFKESVAPFIKRPYVMLSENFSVAKRNYEFLIESDTKLHRVLIPIKAFNNFLKKNAMVEQYINEEKLNVPKLMESRSMNIKSLYLKEFVDNEVGTDLSQEADVLSLEKIDGEDKVRVFFKDPRADEKSSVDIDLIEFLRFAVDNDENFASYIIEFMPGETMIDEDGYFAEELSALETAKNFIKQRHLN